MKSLNLHSDANPQPQTVRTPPKSPLIQTPQSGSTTQDLQKLIKYHSKHSKSVLRLGLPYKGAREFYGSHQQTQISHSKAITKILIQSSQASTSLALIGNPPDRPNRLPPLNLHYPLPSLQSLQNITNINLPLILYPNNNPHRTKLLSHTLTSLKRLTRVSLEISHPLHDNEIHSILRSLCRLPSLSHLAITFSTFQLTSCLFQLLALYISKLSHLKGLILHFTDHRTHVELADLSPIFANLPLLSEFSLKLAHTAGSRAEAVISFLESLGTLKLLSKLHLEITEKTEIFNTERNLVSMNLGKLNLSSLRELSLRFDWCYSDTALLNLSSSLKEFSSLKAMNLDLSKCRYITEKSVSQLALDLEQLLNLSRLALTFPREGRDTHPMMKAFSQNLSSLTGLNDLTLNFSKCPQESVDSVEVFSSSLEKLTGLKSLALIFRGNETITDQTLELLMKGVEKLEGLASLKIDLRGLEVRNEAVQAIESSLSQLQNLKDLKLGFDSVSLKAVASIVKRLHSLYSIELKNSEYVKSDFDFFLDVSKDLVNLRKINLLFASAPKLEEIEVGSLKHQKCVAISKMEDDEDDF